MVKKQMNILVFGAHPDDCDIKAGGVAALYLQQGHRVKFVSVTNGDAGHHEMGGVPLARRRYAEAQAAAEVIGTLEYELLDNHDGELMPTLENRYQIIRAIREFRPDLIMTHRPNDYHPDHRYTSTLVQDAAYMVTVPNICALTPHLKKNPVIVYLSDGFMKPYPFTPDVVVGIDAVIEQKIDMLHCHVSQFYEWLPYNSGTLDAVPPDASARRAWLSERLLNRFRVTAEKYRDVLIALYGEEVGTHIEYAEAFEGCEYGTSLTAENLSTLFPFFQ
ncbi:PIG-L family deacetylase [Candidatus Poribacteria bacterium]|nr:PIG-L family deacetylase [Candidatus Poribacteria bacterium]MYG05582.1 PIG-L family deacetylase [Candidatus Poribacteria bacterium]MYK24789.1 PIG-L family deacetylase [Candidatus Poribacteria bacterium]